MKLATFTQNGRTRIGVVEGDAIADIASEKIPADMVALLEGGQPALDAVRAAMPEAARLPLSSVRLEAPVLRPRKFLGLGASYASHLKEVAHLMPPPKHQTWFNKQVTCVNGPYDDIHLPSVSNSLDYEGELAIIIGARGRNVKGAAVRPMIAGFTVCNDVSVREWQMRAMTATLGKSFDTHGPLGPWIVTMDELPGIHNLSLRTWVNGELRQDGSTSELIYRFGEMIEELTTVFSLEPGDALATGVPAGVGVEACHRRQTRAWYQARYSDLICWSRPNMSALPQCSTYLPSRSLMISITARLIALPVPGMPRNDPLCVPW